MDPLNLLIVVSLVYCALFFIDTIFKTCSHYPYLHFLQNTGLHVEVLRIRWFTAVFNRSIQKWGNISPRLLNYWFIVGSLLSVAMLPVAIYLLLNSIQAMLFKSGYVNISSPVMTLEPVIPGITLPIEDLGYYIATLAISSILHEMGHALAAVRERVRLFGVGLAVFIILPVAYVQLSTEQYQALHPCRQLCIMTAGVWHNMVLSGLAVCLPSAIPLLFSPMLVTNTGVSVTYLTPLSSLVGSTGLQEGDHIISINNCTIAQQVHWEQCIQEAITQPSTGYCVSYEMDSVTESNEEQCCPESETNHLCFQRITTKSFFCMRARSIIQSSSSTCLQASDCSNAEQCLKPVLGNSTKLVRIYRMNSEPVLFLGRPAEIYYSVKISKYVPLYRWASTRLPHMLSRLCDYMATLSAGLAVINLVPCFWFDGQHILTALIHLLLLNVISKRGREAVAFCLTMVGTLMLSVWLPVKFYEVVTR